MDIQLPVMDGITATRHIRAEEKENDIGIYPSTPMGEPSRLLEALPSSSKSSVIIVALTASSLHTDRTAALAAGCNDFLTKPVSLKWLEKKIVEWGCMQVSPELTGQADLTSGLDRFRRLEAVEGRRWEDDGRDQAWFHRRPTAGRQGRRRSTQDRTQDAEVAGKATFDTLFARQTCFAGHCGARADAAAEPCRCGAEITAYTGGLVGGGTA